MASISITHLSDPGCPFAYSALPALTALQWRYGDQLSWRHVLIGLTEDAAQYEARGYTPLKSAIGQQRFRRHGMPFGRQPKPRMAATARACRLVVATRLTQPELEWAMFRALQFVQFTTPLPLDSDEALRAAAERVAGADVDGLLDRLDSPEVTEAYEADRAESRTAAGTPTEFQGKAANTDGKVRYTAPSLIFATPDGRRLEAGGFQSLGAYDVCIANLDSTLARRGPDADVGQLLETFPYGVTTREVAQCLAASNDEPDDVAAEQALLELAATGAAVAEPLGDSTLWRRPTSRFLRRADGAAEVAGAR